MDPGRVAGAVRHHERDGDVAAQAAAAELLLPEGEQLHVPALGLSLFVVFIVSLYVMFLWFVLYVFVCVFLLFVCVLL